MENQITLKLSEYEELIKIKNDILRNGVIIENKGDDTFVYHTKDDAIREIIKAFREDNSDIKEANSWLRDDIDRYKKHLRIMEGMLSKRQYRKYLNKLETIK